MFKKKVHKNTIVKQNNENKPIDFSPINDTLSKTDNFEMECETDIKVNPETEKEIQNYRLFLDEQQLET